MSQPEPPHTPRPHPHPTQPSTSPPPVPITDPRPPGAPHPVKTRHPESSPVSAEPAIPEELQWAMTEAHRELLPIAPGWFRAWPTHDEKWSAVNVRAATQLIVNRSREDGRHPNSWTVRALFGDKAVELRLGPYDAKDQAIWVAEAVLKLAFS